MEGNNTTERFSTSFRQQSGKIFSLESLLTGLEVSYPLAKCYEILVVAGASAPSASATTSTEFCIAAGSRPAKRYTQKVRHVCLHLGAARHRQE